MGWGSYWNFFLLGIGVLCGVGVAVLWAVNPYCTFAYTPFDCAPADSNQRYSYAGVAKNADFDSVVIGTSTARLLRPAVLNERFNATFANLAMDSASAHEQSKVLGAFVANRPRERVANVVIGLDAVWCTVEDQVSNETYQPFREQLYDANVWNDILYMLNFNTLRTAVKQMNFVLGLKMSTYDRDGYRNFLPDDGAYDLIKARAKLYPQGRPDKGPVTLPVADVPDADRAAWRYASHDLLDEMLTKLPEQSRKVLLFVPYHYYWFGQVDPLARAQWAECKSRVVKLAAKHPNTVVLDFMVPSEITTNDRNYWDPLHYNTTVADRLVGLIEDGAGGEVAANGEFTRLYP